MKLFSVDEEFICETQDFPKQFTGMIESDNKTKRWYKDGKPHRDNDLPAIVCTDGELRWFLNGFPHRENNPAIIYKDGSYEYYVYDEKFKESINHNLNGPSIKIRYMHEDNQHFIETIYCVNGKFHREGGPAYTKEMESCNKIDTEYYFEGKLHRLDGPAVIHQTVGKIEELICNLPLSNKKKNSEFKKLKRQLNELGEVKLFFINGKQVSEESLKLYNDLFKIKL